MRLPIALTILKWETVLERILELAFTGGIAFNLLQSVSWLEKKSLNTNSVITNTHLTSVANIISAGKAYGRLRTDNNFIPRCLNNQLRTPLFADSIASWNILMTVSGMFDPKAS